MDFLVDLWKLDMYPSEWKLEKAIIDVWPDFGGSAAKLTAKSLKALLCGIHYKKRRMTSGQKSSEALKKFMSLVGDGQECQISLPVAAEPTAVAAQKVTLARPAKAAVVPAKAAVVSAKAAVVSAKAAVPPQAAVPAEAVGSIAALYGISASSSSGEPLCSQLTISDDVNPSQCSLISDVVEPAKAAVANTYWDYSLCCLMKVTTTPAGVQTAQSVMQPGTDGFADAVFSDSDVIHTEVPNLDLFSLKKPAACIKKKPAAAAAATVVQAEKSESEGAQDDDDNMESDNSGTEMVVPKKPAQAQDKQAEEPHGEPVQHVNAKMFMFPSLTRMKLGLFTGQSYITFKTRYSLKFTLLVSCSQKMASRNGKNHKTILQNVWAHLMTLPTLPEKQVCKQLILDALSA